MDYINIGQLNSLVVNKLKQNKTKSELYIPTFEDITNGIFFESAVNSDKIDMCKNGLIMLNTNYLLSEKVKDSDIGLFYTKLIDINLEKQYYEFSSSECSLELKLVGVFKKLVNTINGTIPFGDVLSNVVVLSKLEKDVDWVEVSDGKVSVKKNDTKTSRETTVELFTFHKGEKITKTITIKQSGKKISDWIFDSNKTLSINLVLDENVVNHNGGNIFYKVFKTYVKNLHRETDGGEIVETKQSEKITDDITSLASVKLTNTNGFKKIKNIIVVSPQKDHARERITIVKASYDGLICEDSLTQLKGLEREYIKELYFNDESLEKSETILSNGGTLYIPLISRTKTLIGKEIVSVENDANLIVYHNDEWVKANIVTRDKHLFLELTVDKNIETKARECEIKISNENEELTLVLTQASDTIESIKYQILTDKNEFVCDEISFKDFSFELTVKKIVTFFSGNKIETITRLPNDTKLIVHTISENKDILTDGKLRLIGGGRYKYSPDYLDGFIENNISMVADFHVVDLNGVYLSDKTSVKITVKPIRMVSIDKHFSFADGSTFKVVELNDTQERVIDIVSEAKNKLDNNQVVATPIGFRYFALNNSNSFTVKEKEGDLIVSLNDYIKSNVEEKYAIYQNGTSKQIVLVLSHKMSCKSKNLQLLVKLENGNEMFDIWVDNNASLSITDCDTNETFTIKLDKGFVSPNNDINTDVLYIGKNDFVLGHTYLFESRDINLLKNGFEKINGDKNIREKILITENNDKIELVIKP